MAFNIYCVTMTSNFMAFIRRALSRIGARNDDPLQSLVSVDQNSLLGYYNNGSMDPTEEGLSTVNPMEKGSSIVNPIEENLSTVNPVEEGSSSVMDKYMAQASPSTIMDRYNSPLMQGSRPIVNQRSIPITPKRRGQDNQHLVQHPPTKVRIVESASLLAIRVSIANINSHP